MAGRFDLGAIGSTGISTGPHSDLRIKDLETGKFIDPNTFKSLLTGIRFGDKPLVEKQGDKLRFNPLFPVTSPFGNRKAPKPGASSYHQGIDFGVPDKTPITIEGYGRAFPIPNNSGYGNTMIFRPADNKYEILFAHNSRLGPEAQVYASNLNAPPQAPVLPPPALTPDTKTDNQTTRFNDQLMGSLLAINLMSNFVPKNNSKTDLISSMMKREPSIANQFLNDYLRDLLNPQPYN
jgi:hypothetical protein